MAESYFTTLTNTGKAMFANSPVLGTPVVFSTLAVGDGNGSYAGLDLASMLQRTALINEVWRCSINHISTHDENRNWLVIEAFIPSDVGDFDIREVGVLDADNNLIAVGKYPHTYKPKIEQGASKDLYVKMILEVTDTAQVELKVDPTVVVATRQHVGDEIKTAVDAERLHLVEVLAAYPEMVRKDESGNVENILSLKGIPIESVISPKVRQSQTILAYCSRGIIASGANSITVTGSDDDPTVFSISNGVDKNGYAKDYIQSFVEDVTYTIENVTDGCHFLCIKPDGNFALLFEHPYVGRKRPTGHSGFFFDATKMIMYDGEGVRTPLLPFCKVQMANGIISNVNAYPVGGYWESEWFGTSVNTLHEKPNPFHTDLVDFDVWWKPTLESEDIRLTNMHYYPDASSMGVYKRLNRDAFVLGTGLTYVYFSSRSADPISSGGGYLQIRAKRRF